MVNVSRSSWLSQFTLPPAMGKGSSDSTFSPFFRFLSVFFILAVLYGLKMILCSSQRTTLDWTADSESLLGVGAGRG